MKTWLVRTRTQSVYIVTEGEGNEGWGFGAQHATTGKALRFLSTRFPIQPIAPWPPMVGGRLVVHGMDDSFPSSSGVLYTSGIEAVEEVR